jgi:SAM-dependent methyltransferase
MGARVFEIGFGDGALLRRFLDDGAVVSGVDPGALALTIDPVVAGQATLHTAPLASVVLSDQHDLVFAGHVAEHVADAGSFARACHDLVGPGGRVVLVTPAADSAGLRIFGSRWWMFEDPTHVRFFTARSITRLLEDAGLVDVRVRRLVLDSLATDAASVVRSLRWRRLPPAGVLPARSTRAVVLLSAPLIVILRLLRPMLRPALEVSARRPGAQS